MGTQWRGAWRELRARPDIECMVCDLPGTVRALVARRGPDIAILVNRNLLPMERLIALTHEFVHLERGGGCHQPRMPDLLRVAVARDERRVQDAAITRCVPLEDVRAYVAAMADMGEPVEAWQVAEEFGIEQPTASDVLRLLRQAA